MIRCANCFADTRGRFVQWAQLDFCEPCYVEMSSRAASFTRTVESEKADKA